MCHVAADRPAGQRFAKPAQDAGPGLMAQQFAILPQGLAAAGRKGEAGELRAQVIAYACRDEGLRFGPAGLFEGGPPLVDVGLKGIKPGGSSRSSCANRAALPHDRKAGMGCLPSNWP
jgi:hypothetical protein